VVNSLYHISAGISSFFGSPHFNTYIVPEKFSAAKHCPDMPQKLHNPAF
jgi:hypothetical protein